VGRLSTGTLTSFFYSRGNYDPKNQPVIPLMLWKPYAPIYPKLVKNVAEGLTFEETNEMSNR
jgi:hypothetical protein